MAIMQYNSQSGQYEAALDNGVTLIVDGDIYAEQEQAGVDPRELESSATWEACVDGEGVRYYTQSVKSGLGRPSSGRTVNIQIRVTPQVEAWLNTQRKRGESASAVVYRLLDGLRQADTQE